VTTTSPAPPVAAEHVGVPSASEVAALIAEAPVPRPTLVKTFNAMMAREFRVLRRNAIATFTRAVMQPLLFVFVFAYVFPKIGGGFMLGGGAEASGRVTGSINFATILVPGLMASMLLMQGIMAVTFPLVMEFSWQRTIEDRARHVGLRLPGYPHLHQAGPQLGPGPRQRGNTAARPGAVRLRR
jgi:hypothetical protein